MPSDTREENYDVFPTCVGMNRYWWMWSDRMSGVPHVRGDEPYHVPTYKTANECSPHAWG